MVKEKIVMLTESEKERIVENQTKLVNYQNKQMGNEAPSDSPFLMALNLTHSVVSSLRCKRLSSDHQNRRDH